MAQTKQSARQLTDAAAATITTPKTDDTKPTPKRSKGTRPDGFVGDRPGFFRGARIK